jgi:ribosomal protein L1
MVHTGVMPKDKAVRQSVTLPENVAKQVRNLAKRRRLSANRMLVELVEEGIELQKRKEKAFFELAERFRTATDPKEIRQLGDQLGKMVFGS